MQLLSTLLDQDHLPRFEFIVEEKLLRGELKSHLLRYELTAEKTLHIEFTLSFPNINDHSKTKEEDWVSAISLIPGPEGPLALAAALYNGNIVIHDLALQQLLQIETSEDPVKTLTILPCQNERTYYRVSGGLSETLNVHFV